MLTAAAVRGPRRQLLTMAHTSTASSAPDAVPRVPGGGPGECGLVRGRFSLCTQQLTWCAVEKLSLIVSYVMSTAAVGRVYSSEASF